MGVGWGLVIFTGSNLKGKKFKSNKSSDVNEALGSAKGVFLTPSYYDVAS